LLINGKPYVFGEQAEHHGRITRRKAGARYTPDYYGVFAAYTMGRAFKTGGEVGVFASHAPGYIDFRENLMDSVLGQWDVIIGSKDLSFDVQYVNTFDEPKGGLMNVVLTEDGTRYQHSDINGNTALVIDIGGHTTDWLRVQAGGKVDYSLNESTPIGILDIMKNFEKAFKPKLLKESRGLDNLPPESVREAIKTGLFAGGGRNYPCQPEVDQAVSKFLNEVGEAYTNVAGGPLPYHTIVLTGGGSAALYDLLIPILEHDRVMLADVPGTIHLANVRGGFKLHKLLEALEQ
jgi:hypothetical protein